MRPGRWGGARASCAPTPTSASFYLWTPGALPLSTNLGLPWARLGLGQVRARLRPAKLGSRRVCVCGYFLKVTQISHSWYPRRAVFWSACGEASRCAADQQCGFYISRPFGTAACASNGGL